MNAYGEPDSQPEYRPRGPQGPNPYLAPAREAFWLDESERLTYEHAVEVNPRGKDEGAITYLARIAALAAGRLAPAAKPMPAAPQATAVDVTPRKGQEQLLVEPTEQREPGCDDGDDEVSF